MRHKYRYLSTGRSLQYWIDSAKEVDLKSIFHDAPSTIREAKELQERNGEMNCNILQLDSNFNPIRFI